MIGNAGKGIDQTEVPPERVKVDDFYNARSGIVPPLPWPTFPPPLKWLLAGLIYRHDGGGQQHGYGLRSLRHGYAGNRR